MTTTATTQSKYKTTPKPAAKSGGKYAFVSKGKISASGNNFLEGDHYVKVLKCLDIDGHSGNYFIAECEILESTSMKPGQVAGFKVNMSAKKDIAANSLFTFAAACLGLGQDDEEAISELADNVESVIEEAIYQGGFDGKTLRVRAKATTSKDGHDYMKLTARPE